MRLVGDPDEPGAETLVVMVDAPGLGVLHRELSAALGVELRPPSAQVTLYVADPARGAGIDAERGLVERAPALAGGQQEEVRRATRLGEVLFDGGGIPLGPTGDGAFRSAPATACSPRG